RGARRRGPGAPPRAVAPGHDHLRLDADHPRAGAGPPAARRPHAADPPPPPPGREPVGRRLVVPTLETFTGRDGLPLTGWLYRAAGADGPGPAALSFHGGAEAQERPTFDPQHQALAAAGITVFAPNIRGWSGFGREFVHADDVGKRWAAFDDVLA